MEKTISVVYVSWRDQYRNIFTGCSLEALYSEIKRKDVHHNNRRKTMWRLRRGNAVHCLLSIPHMVVVHGRVHISLMLI